MSIISVEPNCIINDDVFLQNIWNQFYQCLIKKKNITLDFRNITFIQSTVIPKLCCLGIIAKKNGLKVEFLPSDRVARYLSEFDFWNIILKYDIFKFDEKYLERNRENKKVTNAFFCIERDDLIKKYENKFEFREEISLSTKTKYLIKAELVGERNIGDKGEYAYKNMSSQCQAVLRTMSNFFSYSKYTSEDIIIDSLVELVHNSVQHGGGLCFVMVQACTYKCKKGIEISVADTGMGLYRSLIGKGQYFSPKCYKRTAFFNIEDSLTQNYCSIIEALMYRKESVVRGIYNILDDLAREPDDVNSEFRVVNGNISLYLEKDNIKKLVSGNLDELLAEQKEYIRQKKNINYSFSVDMCMYQTRREE